MFNIINKIINWFREDDELISKEGWEILEDPKKRVKLRKYISHYHATGQWDTKIMNDGPTKTTN